jgi:uncharacterized protein YoxC
MPLYASPSLTPTQGVLVAIALACFLVCILLGIGKLSRVLQAEARSLAELQDALERRDTAVLTRREEEDRRRDKKRKVEIIGTAVDCLFAAGILLLLFVIAVGLFKR